MSVFTTQAYSVTQPSAIVAGENPIILGIGTHSNGTATYALTQFHVVDLVTMKDNFSVTINTRFGYSKKFTAKDYPNKDEYFFTSVLKDKDGVSLQSNSTNEIAYSFAEALEKDVIISNNYYIQASGSSVLVKAKQPSEVYNIAAFDVDVKNFTGGTTTSGITVTILTVGNSAYEGAIIDDYNIYCEVYNSTSEFGTTLNKYNFNRITEVQLPFSQDNKHRFDLSNICKSFVSTSKHSFDINTPLYIPNFLSSFYFKYGEKFPWSEGDVRKREKGSTGFKWVTNSAIDLNLPNDLSTYTATTNCKFFTNTPSIKRSTKNSKEFLYFLLRKNLYQDIKLYGDVTFWNGTTSNNVMLLDLGIEIPGNSGGLWAIPCSYEALYNLRSLETSTKKIKTVAFSLKRSSGTVRISEIKTLKFDYVHPVSEYGLAFLNSMGTYDFVSFQGLQTEDISREAIYYTLPLDINTDGSIVEGSKNNAAQSVNVTRKITVNSGLISQSEFDWLIELLKSTEVYSYHGTDNYLKLDSFKYTSTNQSNEYVVECVFLQTIVENSVTQ